MYICYSEKKKLSKTDTEFLIDVQHRFTTCGTLKFTMCEREMTERMKNLTTVRLLYYDSEKGIYHQKGNVESFTDAAHCKCSLRN